MSWTTQAIHVARKDVRFTRVALALYSVIVVVALMHALALPDRSNPGSISSALDGAMFILVLLGLIITATVVQADSPIQSNAFWASRPFDPTAMLGAKLIYAAAVVLGIPLVAQLVGLMLFGVEPQAMLAIMLKSGVAYGLMLLCAVVVASLTTDLRGFVVAALVIVVGLVLAVAAGPSVISQRISDPPFAGPFAVAIVASGAVLTWLYRRRDVSRRAWLGALVAVGAAMVALGANDVAPERDLPTTTPSTADIRVAPAGAPRFGTMGVGVRVPIRFSFGAVPAGADLNLRVDSAVLHLRDGTRVAALPFYGRLSAGDGRGVLPPGVTLYGVDPNMPATASATLAFDADSARIAAAGVAGLEVWSHVMVTEAVTLATTSVDELPYRTTSHGVRLLVSDAPDIPARRSPTMQFAGGSGDLSISVVASTLQSARTSNGIRNVGMAVINESRHSGIVASAGSYSSSTNWMVLPGAALNTSVISLRTPMPNETGAHRVVATPAGGEIIETSAPIRVGPMPDDAWYRNAKIVVVQWVPRGSYPLHLSTPLS
jgi:hypothetical protein